MWRKKLLTGTLLFSAFRAYTLDQNASSGLQKELLGADRGIWQAIAGPRPQLDQVRAALAADYLDIDSGVRHSREEVLEYLQGVTKFSFRYQSARAYVLSPTVGYVIAELSYTSVENGKPVAGKVLTTTVFSKEHGQWKAHLHTEMEQKPEKR